MFLRRNRLLSLLDLCRRVISMIWGISRRLISLTWLGWPGDWQVAKKHEIWTGLLAYWASFRWTGDGCHWTDKSSEVKRQALARKMLRSSVGISLPKLNFGAISLFHELKLAWLKHEPFKSRSAYHCNSFMEIALPFLLLDFSSLTDAGILSNLCYATILSRHFFLWLFLVWSLFHPHGTRSYAMPDISVKLLLVVHSVLRNRERLSSFQSVTHSQTLVSYICFLEEIWEIRVNPQSWRRQLLGFRFSKSISF